MKNPPSGKHSWDNVRGRKRQSKNKSNRLCERRIKQQNLLDVTGGEDGRKSAVRGEITFPVAICKQFRSELKAEGKASDLI